MRTLTVSLFALALGGSCFAQQWEVGGAGGIGFHNNLTVSRASGSVDAGLKTGPMISAFATQNLYDHLGGQVRYTLGLSSLKLSGNGADASFDAQTHAINYDLLFFANGKDSAVRPYLAGGGGFKIYRGTGAEQTTQPLGQYALLTKTQEVKGMISVGGGFKLKVGARVFVVVDVHDYITPAPSKVIAPYTNSKMSGWVHAIVPSVGLSFGF